MQLILFIVVGSVHAKAIRSPSGGGMMKVEGESWLINRRRKTQQEAAFSLENTDSYISSPFALPPFESLSPQTAPSPFCFCPPSTPIFEAPAPTYTNTPLPNPSPNYPPTPPSPPIPRQLVPSPPPKHAPFIRPPPPPIFEPPVVLPPPSTPPPPHKAPPQNAAVWCVAKPTVPDPIIQEAMDYACGKGADCEAIKPDGLCYQPNTLFAHASYAFNSYWQKTKVAGGTCNFGGTAMLVTVNPSKSRRPRPPLIYQ